MQLFYLTVRVTSFYNEKKRDKICLRAESHCDQRNIWNEIKKIKAIKIHNLEFEMKRKIKLMRKMNDSYDPQYSK